MKSTAVVLGLLGFVSTVACGGESASPPPASPTTPASASAPATPAPTDSAAQTTAAASSASATQPTPSTPTTSTTAPAPEKTFTHSKLGFAFSYPDGLSVKEEAKGATVESAQPIAKVEDRSGKSKTPIDTKFVVRINVEDGNVPAVAKKTNPGFADAFPKGQESAWKEQKDFAEKVTTSAGNTAYKFTMGSHGNNEQDTFIAGKNNKTLVVKCSLTGDNFKPTMSAAEQMRACDQIVSSLKP